MKVAQLYRNAVIFIITVTAGLILLMAQINYQAAINETCEQSDFSDSGIENTMLKYGFNVDANSITHPTTAHKVKALFTK